MNKIRIFQEWRLGNWEIGEGGIAGVGCFLQLGGVIGRKFILLSVREGTPTLKLNGKIVE